jgi:hypothetical protein
MATKTKVSLMVGCFETMQEVARKYIVNAFNFEELKATVIETIVKNKANEKYLAGRVEK